LQDDISCGRGLLFLILQYCSCEVPYPTYPNRFSWIYKVPRRW
jgi:hypothetical protein